MAAVFVDFSKNKWHQWHLQIIIRRSLQWIKEKCSWVQFVTGWRPMRSFFPGTVARAIEVGPWLKDEESARAPLPSPALHSFRRLHSIDVRSFRTDLKSSQLISDPPKSLRPLLSAYNTTISSLLDKYAPIVTKLSMRQSPSNPWFSTTLRAFWSTLRHAENIWKRTHSDWSSFKSLRNQQGLF